MCALRKLVVRHAVSLTTAEQIRGDRLRHLELQGASTLAFDFLARCNALQYLRLAQSNFEDLSLLLELGQLRYLFLEGCSLDWIDQLDLPQLQYFIAPVNFAVENFREPKPLRGLRLAGSIGVRELVRLVSGPELLTLDLLDLTPEGDKELGTVAPNLKRLVLRSSRAVDGLEHFGLLGHLEHLQISSAELESVEGDRAVP
jgi:hypothetical protein